MLNPLPNMFSMAPPLRRQAMSVGNAMRSPKLYYSLGMISVTFIILAVFGDDAYDFITPQREGKTTPIPAAVATHDLFITNQPPISQQPFTKWQSGTETISVPVTGSPKQHSKFTPNILKPTFPVELVTPHTQPTTLHVLLHTMPNTKPTKTATTSTKPTAYSKSNASTMIRSLNPQMSDSTGDKRNREAIGTYGMFASGSMELVTWQSQDIVLKRPETHYSLPRGLGRDNSLIIIVLDIARETKNYFT